MNSAQRGETTHVWVPAGSDERHLALLPSGAVIHVAPADPTGDSRLGPGQFVVAGFSRAGFPDLLRRLDDVRVVQAMSAGVDDLVGRIPPGVVLCDGAGIHDVAVAEWVVMAILAMNRHLSQSVLDQAAAHWGSRRFRDADLEGATALIVGYGSIGKAVERRLEPFGVKMLRAGRHARDGVGGPGELPSLVAQADVVVILLPLTRETHRFVDEAFIAQMKHGALLVNPSRGGVVDTAALMAALDDGRIRAALDVTDPEPLPDGHQLWGKDGLLVTPHVAGLVVKAADRAWALVAMQLRHYLDGSPLENVVQDGY